MRGALVLAPAVAVAATVIGLSAVRGTDDPSSWHLVVRDEAGAVLHEASLRSDAFALRYRNSLHGSVAEERFVISDDGEMTLVELAAEDAAVLAEYYGVAVRDRVGRLSVGPPAQPVVIRELRVAATELGERTLLVDGAAPVALWQLVPDGAPVVVLTAERTR